MAEASAPSRTNHDIVYHLVTVDTPHRVSMPKNIPNLFDIQRLHKVTADVIMEVKGKIKCKTLLTMLVSENN